MQMFDDKFVHLIIVRFNVGSCLARAYGSFEKGRPRTSLLSLKLFSIENKFRCFATETPHASLCKVCCCC